MEIDKAKLKKWQDVVEFASDPERLSMLDALISQNGSTGKPNSAERTVERTESANRPWQEGTKVGAIAEAALDSEKPFSGYALAQKMEAAGFDFGKISKPGLTVADVLRNTLVKRGVVRVFRKGRGNAPTLYERVLP